MRIRTQLMALVATTVGLSILAIATILEAGRSETDAAQAQSRAQVTAHEVAGLLTLTQEFARDGEARAAQQWHQRHRAIAAALHGESAQVQGQAQKGAALAELERVAVALPPLFVRMEGLPATGDAFHDRRKAALLDQLLTSTQAMSDYAYQWFQDAAATRSRLERDFRRIAVSVSVLMTLALLFITATLQRRVLVPLAGLNGAALAVGRGDLSLRLACTRADEFGDLSRQFDAMVAALADVRGRIERSESQLRAIADNLPAMISYIDSDRRYEFANARYADWLGLDPAAMIGRRVEEVVGEPDAGIARGNVEKALAGTRFQWDGQVQGRGDAAFLLAEYIPDFAPDGSVRGCYALTIDITAMKEAQRQQSRTERRLRAITDNLPVLITYVDPDERYGFANLTMRDWLGIDPAAAIGRKVADIVPAAYGQAHAEPLRRALCGERVSFEAWSETLGAPRMLQTTYIPDVQPDGSVAGVYTLSTDVTAMKNVERQLSLLARSDALTGLPNRYHFNEAVPMALARARRSGLAVALMFLDVDHFKSINDTLGHAAGDAVLCEFASRLRRSVRSTDSVARLAGDEFVVTLEGLHGDTEPERVAQKILTQMGRPFDVAGEPMSVTTSIGIAYHDPAGPETTAADLLAQADQALYAAKRAGRNTVRGSLMAPLGAVEALQA